MRLHEASITTVQWAEVRDDVCRVRPEFASIIDALNPGRKFKLFKARYPFGARIMQGGDLHIPTDTGSVEPITSPYVSENIKTNLQRRELPVTLFLNNSAEIFYTMPDRVISRFLIQTGGFFGLWEHFGDPETGDYVKWVWSLVAGARTLFMLPKLTDTQGHKELRKKYGVRSHAPKTYSDQWKVFVEIANSQKFTEEWRSEVLFFSDVWMDTAAKDPAWKGFYDYLFKVAWQESRYWRNKNTFELIWESFVYDVMDKNIKPSVYLSNVVKHIILTGVGEIPGLAVADNNNAAPIKKLQQVYIEDYKLRSYIPVFMQPHSFSYTDKFPSYYLLQQPNLLDTSPSSRYVPSILSAIPDIQYLLQSFQEKVATECIAENTPIDIFCKNVQYDYFHYIEEKYNDIKHTSELPAEDKRFLISPIGEKNKVFPEASTLIRGCVRLKNKEKTK